MADTADRDSPAAADFDTQDYHALDPWAIAALVLGLASPLALLAKVLLLVPVLGVLVSSAALVRVAREAGQPGRRLALAGLALAIVFLIMPLSRDAAVRLLLPMQARPVADRFFELLRQRQPQEALLLHTPPDYRRPPDADLWTYYRGDDQARHELEQFVATPIIRMLLALGERAEVRYLGTYFAISDGNLGHVDFRYAVTFTDDDGRKKTLVLGVLMEREPAERSDLNPWQVRDFSVGVDPGV